jgi:hypothetical protein
MREFIYMDDNLPVVEVNGELFWDSDEEVPDGFEVEEDDMIINESTPFRRAVGTGDFKEFTYNNQGLPSQYNRGAFNTDDDYLADRRDLRLYKKLQPDFARPLFQDNSFIIFKNETQSFYCIRNGCDKCEFQKQCDPILVMVDTETNKVIKEI